jgi:hypothetical protein
MTISRNTPHVSGGESQGPDARLVFDPYAPLSKV